MKLNRVNMGDIIREKLKEQGVSKAAFAKGIGLQRQNIEKTVLNKASLDCNLLCEISEFLDCNLFDYYHCNTSDSAHEIKAVITIEMGSQKQNKTLKFLFGKNVAVVEDAGQVSIR